MNTFQIALDGPAGAGKSTVAKMIARQLKIEYIDTGAMYRAVTLKLLKYGCSLKNLESITKVLNETSIDFREYNIYLDGENVNDCIRMPDITKNVSRVSSIAIVRKKLVAMQREIAKEKNVIMDGRDIGTNVLKNSKYKIYLTASVDERTHRRWQEMRRNGVDISFDKIKEEIILRDEADSKREINPLIQAEDAILIDSTGKGTERVVKEILSLIKMNDPKS